VAPRKEFVMTPRFLREEAARFRDMADTSSREASKLRFLAMATDFEARAKAADESTKQNPTDPIKVGERGSPRNRARASAAEEDLPTQ
jgi:hypothetical protein